MVLTRGHQSRSSGRKSFLTSGRGEKETAGAKHRRKVSSGGKYEEIMGYSRAVRAGNLIFVSGTADLDAGSDSYVQTKNAISKINDAITKLGGSLSDVVRTRVFVKSDVDWKEVLRAHREAFGSIMPASTLVVVSFLDPKVGVEIEADAVLSRPR